MVRSAWLFGGVIRQFFRGFGELIIAMLTKQYYNKNEEIERRYMAKEIVKYNNNLNKISLKNFTKQDMNLFYAICVKMKNKGTDTVVMSFSEIKKMIGYKRSNERFVEDLTKMLIKLQTCNGILKNGKRTRIFTLFPVFDFDEDDKLLEVNIANDFVYLLNDVAQEFTSFEFKEFCKIKSSGAKTLYRILKQWKTLGKTNIIAPNDLREQFSVNYENKRLMRDVIKPSIAEINENGYFKNLTVETVYERRQGRPVKGYIFHFDPEDISGQISFTNNETFDAICQDMSSEEIAATLAVAKNIVKSKEKPKKSKKKADSFNNFDARIIDKRYRELRDNAIMLQSLGMPIPDDLQKEMDALSKERG